MNVLYVSNCLFFQYLFGCRSVFLAGSGGFGCFGAVVSREYAAVSSCFCAGWLLSSAVFGVGRPVFAVFWCYPPVDQFVSVLEMISELYESFI